jgi:hypothetical protein
MMADRESPHPWESTNTQTLRAGDVISFYNYIDNEWDTCTIVQVNARGDEYPLETDAGPYVNVMLEWGSRVRKKRSTETEGSDFFMISTFNLDPSRNGMIEHETNAARMGRFVIETRNDLNEYQNNFGEVSANQDDDATENGNDDDETYGSEPSTLSRSSKPAVVVKNATPLGATIIPTGTGTTMQHDQQGQAVHTYDEQSRASISWTLEELMSLVGAVITYGEGNWHVVVASVQGRSDIQCRDKLQQILVAVAKHEQQKQQQLLLVLLLLQEQEQQQQRQQQLLLVLLLLQEQEQQQQQQQQNRVRVDTTSSFPSGYQYPVPGVFPTFHQHPFQHYPAAINSFPPMYHQLRNIPALMQQGGPARNVIHQQGSGHLYNPYLSTDLRGPGLVALATDPQDPYCSRVEERARKRPKV